MQAHSGRMFQARKQNPALAAMLICIASAFIAATTLFAKALGSDAFGPALHPLQISHGRYVFAFLGLVMVAGVMRPKFDAPHWGLHIVRTTFGWAGVTLMFASVAYIPLADATAIPVFAMMLAVPLLGGTGRANPLGSRNNCAYWRCNSTASDTRKFSNHSTLAPWGCCIIRI
jgi:drug/metabolite transporter (DMT)-like permease